MKIRQIHSAAIPDSDGEPLFLMRNSLRKVYTGGSEEIRKKNNRRLLVSFAPSNGRKI